MSEHLTPSDDAPDPPLAPGWLRALAIALAALLVSTFAWWPMLVQYPLTQNGDGQYFHRLVEAARAVTRIHHELPLWNPFECGGVPLWDNPQSIVASPILWLLSPFTTTRAMELWYLIHSALGFASMWLFARHELRLARTTTFACASMWAFSGFHAHHESGGHAAFVAFQYLPLAMLLWRRASDAPWCAIGLGALFAWMIHEGAVYPLPHFAVLLAAESLTRAWPLRRAGRIAVAGLVVGVVALTLGASRFLPVLDQLRAHTRGLQPESDHLTWPTLREMFLNREHARMVEGQEYVWTEYATYLGPICLVLALIGIVTCGFDGLWLLALLLFSLALMFGHISPHAPWSILKGHVFPFKEMRVPSRFRVEASFFLIAFAGLGAERLLGGVRRWRRLDARPALRRALMQAVTAGVVFGGADVVSVANSTFWQFFTSPPETPVAASPRLYYGGKDLAPFLDEPRQNRGRVQCWDEWGFGAGAPVWEGDVPQAKAMDDGVVVEVANRTANTFTLDVDVKRPARVRVNSTFDRNWRTSEGALAEDKLGLALDLTRVGRYRVALRYRPRLLTLGFALTALGLLGVALYALRRPIAARLRRSPPA